MDQSQPLPLPTHTPDGMTQEPKNLEQHVVLEKKPQETSHPSGGNSDVVYPSMREVVPIMLALWTVMFLYLLDRSIISTAIPRITDEFSSLGDVGWYASAYMLTSSALMLLFGKIYTIYSPKYVLLTSVGLFELGSAICGAAPSSLAFIIGRAVAGWGSSGIFTGAVVAIQHVLPLQKRPMVMGMMGFTFGISSVAGPLIGGALTEKISWRWCFYINLPIGAVAMAVIVLVLKVPSPAKAGTSIWQHFIQLDPLGTLCFLPGISCLLLALQWGGSKFVWNDVRIIVLLALGVLLIIAFIIIQVWKPDTATIPPRIFKQRSIAAGFSYSLCNGAAIFVMIYYLPQWFQAVKGVDAVDSGIDTLPFLIALTIATVTAGATVSKMGYYVPPMLAGPVFMAIGAGLITTFRTDTTTPTWIGYQILFGFGVGLGMQQASVAAQTILSKKDVAIGSALMMFAQQISGAVFVSIAQNVFINRLVSELSGIGSLDPLDIVNTGATEIAAAVPSTLLNTVLLAYNNALIGPFTVTLAMASIAIVPALLMEWRSVKEKRKNAEEA